jgi:hypothetical protein
MTSKYCCAIFFDLIDLIALIALIAPTGDSAAERRTA